MHSPFCDKIWRAEPIRFFYSRIHPKSSNPISIFAMVCILKIIPFLASLDLYGEKHVVSMYGIDITLASLGHAIARAVVADLAVARPESTSTEWLRELPSATLRYVKRYPHGQREADKRMKISMGWLGSYSWALCQLFLVDTFAGELVLFTFPRSPNMWYNAKRDKNEVTVTSGCLSLSHISFSALSLNARSLALVGCRKCNHII